MSSTAVLSVSVASCSRCAVCTVSAWLLRELAQTAHQLLGVTAEREVEAAAFHPGQVSCRRAGRGSRAPLPGSARRPPPGRCASRSRTASRRSGRAPARAAAPRSRSGRGGAGVATVRWRADRDLELADGLLGVLDRPAATRSSRIATSCDSSSSRSPPPAASAAISQRAVIVTASRTSIRLRDDGSGVVDDDPGALRVLGARLERADVAALAAVGLGGEDGGHRSPRRSRGRQARRPRAPGRRSGPRCARIERCRHVPSTPEGCSPRWGRPTTASVPRCRSVRIRAGGGSSSPGCRSDGGPVLDVATGTGLVAARAARPRLRGHGARPEPGDARRGTPSVR